MNGGQRARATQPERQEGSPERLPSFITPALRYWGVETEMQSIGIAACGECGRLVCRCDGTAQEQAL